MIESKFVAGAAFYHLILIKVDIRLHDESLDCWIRSKWLSLLCSGIIYYQQHSAPEKRKKTLKRFAYKHVL